MFPQGGGDRRLPRPELRLDAADRAGPVLTVLGHRRAAAGVGRTGPAARRTAAYAPVRNPGRAGVLPGALPRTPRGVHGEPGLARSGRLVRPRRVAGRCLDRRDGRDRHVRRTLPVVECPARLWHRPGPGHARRRDRGRARCDGAASNEYCALWEELRHAVLFARAKGGPQALAVRDAADLATMGGVRVLDRQDEIGSLEVGKLADIAGLATGHPGPHRRRRPGGRPGAGRSTPAGAAGQRCSGDRAEPPDDRRSGRPGQGGQRRSKTLLSRAGR